VRYIFVLYIRAFVSLTYYIVSAYGGLTFFVPSLLVYLPRLRVGATTYLPQAYLFLPLFLLLLPLSLVTYVTYAPTGILALRLRVLIGYLL